MSDPRITYAPRPDATPEGEISALAAVYKFALEKKMAAAPTPEPGSRDAKVRSSDDFRADKAIIPE